MKVDAVSFNGNDLQEIPPAADKISNDRKQAQNQLAMEPGKSKVQPEELLDKIKSLTDNGSYTVHFELDDKVDEMIITLVDSETGDVIRQIPPEELLGVMQNLKNLRGNIVKTQS